MLTSRKRNARWSRYVVVASIGGALAVPAWTGSAGAYVRDVQISTALMPPSNSRVQEHGRSCPATKPLALGSGATGPVTSFLNGLGVDVASGHTGGVRPYFAGEWAMTTQLTCATATGSRPTFGTGAKYVKDVTIVRSASAANGADSKSAEARCPDGRYAIGAGFDGAADGAPVPAAPWQVSMSGGRVRVFSRELVPSSAPWTIGATAVCANISTVVGNHSYPATVLPPRLAESPADSTDHKYVSAQCPQSLTSKRYVIGGGAEVLGAPGVFLPPAGVMLTRSAPPTTPRATQWAGWAREHQPTDQPWRLRVRVVCASLVGHSFGLR